MMFALVFRALSIYLGVGAAWQLGMWWYGRRKFGAYGYDVALRIVLGRYAIAKVLGGCVLWPIGMYVYFFASPERTRRQYANEIAAWKNEMAERCPDCGGSLEAHTHEEPPIN